MEALLKPYEYEVPCRNLEVARWVLGKTWWVWGFTGVLGILWAVFLKAYPADNIGMLILAAGFVVTLGIVSWRSVHHAANPRFFYEIDGPASMTFEFWGDRYYAPPEEVSRVVKRVVDEFEKFYDSREAAEEVLDGTHVIVKPEKLDKPPEANAEAPDKVNGWTAVLDKIVRIYGKHLLDPTGFGWELSRIYCQDLRPYRSEESDWRWMVEEDVGYVIDDDTPVTW